MGRLIEESRVVEILQQTWLSGTIAHRFIDDINRRIRIEVPTVEAIPKADYEKRLKADMVAMLTDFLMDIEENTSINATNSDERNGKRFMRTEIIGMFEKKINSLKENT